MFRQASAVLIFLLVCLAVPASALAGTVQLHAGDNGHFTTRATINGTSVRLMVDTGSSTVALNYADARRVGFRPESLEFETPVATSNGLVKAARVMIGQIEIGGILVENVDGVVMPEGTVTGSLLGMSYLSRLRSFEVRSGVLYLRD